MADNKLKRTTPKVRKQGDIDPKQFGKFSNKVNSSLRAIESMQSARTADYIGVGTGATVDDVIEALQAVGLMKTS